MFKIKKLFNRRELWDVLISKAEELPDEIASQLADMFTKGVREKDFLALLEASTVLLLQDPFPESLVSLLELISVIRESPKSKRTKRSYDSWSFWSIPDFTDVPELKVGGSLPNLFMSSGGAEGAAAGAAGGAASRTNAFGRMGGHFNRLSRFGDRIKSSALYKSLGLKTPDGLSIGKIFYYNFRQKKLTSFRKYGFNFRRSNQSGIPGSNNQDRFRYART